MKVLLHGDLFITNQVLRAAIEKTFEGSGITFEYDYLTDDWPVVPVQETDEVREFVGSDELIVPKVADVEMIATHSAPITRRVIEAAKFLKVVGAARGGPVNINSRACTERGIPVVYAPGRNSGAVAEHTVALILAETRSVARAHISLMQEMRWRGDLYVFEKVGLELNSAVVGIIGFGAIGRKVAHILAGGFGSKILAYDPYVPAEEITRLGYRPVSLEELLRESDIISLNARLTPQTRGMLGEREFGLVKKSAYLVNTARGELIQHEHLYRALQEKRLAGAALDVFEAEPPPPESPIYQLDNVTATTHLGGASIQAAEIGADIMAGEIYKFLVSGETPKYCVNPEVFARP